jgi:riboflavin biosynthesis pyrimidine reductase
VDKLLVFVAPRLSGRGPGPVAALPEAVELRRLASERVGEDLLLRAYVHEP